MRTMPRIAAVTSWLVLVASLPVAAQEHPMRGDEAPEFRLESLEGESLALSDFRGDYVVLHFGAGW